MSTPDSSSSTAEAATPRSSRNARITTGSLCPRDSGLPLTRIRRTSPRWCSATATRSRPARPFDLPAEAEDARRVINELHAATQRISKVHTFGKGMGVAAPQIGIERAAAIVRPPGGDDLVALLNPRIIEAGEQQDEQYEGCLSFFDVRCLVPRPVVLHVEHQEISGERRITIFQRGIARLVAHEVDHLHGVLCTDHLPPEVRPIPVEQYRGTGADWNYPADG